MFPQLAGGQGDGRRRPSGRVAPQAALALAALCLAVPQARAEAVGAQAGAGFIQVMAPVSAQQPAGSLHWTLREPITLAQAGDAAEAVQPRRGKAHVEVAMFSWRELLFYAAGIALVVGALLALTGGHGRRSPHI